MTARDQARPSERRLAERDLGRGRPPVASAAAPSVPRLGEMLLDARERKGVDLYRAERDTKIRARFLAALERSDFRELPGAVYTKGFLRNYALYLGLDPEAVLAQWKSEVGDVRRQEPTIIVPRPLEAPRSGLTFTRGIVVTAVLTLAVVAFAGYIALQLFRFSQPPELTVDQSAVSQVNAETAVLSGTSDAGMTVSILAVGRETYRLTVPADGRWEQVVPLKKGRNDFTVTATDPATGKDSPPVRLIVTVPIPQGPEAPTLEVSSPNDETAFTNGAIPVQGTTNAISIVVSATYLGPAGTIPSGQPTPQPPPMPEPVEMAVDPDTGAFSDAYQLAPGRWQLTITATGPADKTTTERRTISVEFTGVNLVISVRDAAAWLKVWVDDQLVPGYEAGSTVRAGKTLEFTGKTSVEVRTGNSGATFFTLNGSPLGALGKPGIPETWRFAPPALPEKTGRTN